MQLFREVLNALVPSRCLICRRSGWSLCRRCRANLELKPRATQRIVTHGSVRGLSLFDYLPPMPALIDSFKEHGATELALLLVDSIDSVILRQELFTAFGFDLAVADEGASTLEGGATSSLALVPIPSSTDAFRSRGFSPANEVAKAFASRLGADGVSVRVVRLLKRSREVADQSTLTTQERWHNQTESMVARHDYEGRVILIDDIVTTGATLVEAKRAVEKSGAQVIGFCTLAETLRKRDINFSKPNT